MSDKPLIPETDVGALIYRGNTVSYLYDKMLAYKASVGRARDGGVVLGRKDREPEIASLQAEVERLREALTGLYRVAERERVKVEAHYKREPMACNADQAAHAAQESLGGDYYRALTQAERALPQEEPQAWTCPTCGASLGPNTPHCPHSHEEPTR